MPRERTAVTAGDHIDCSTTSPEAMRLTDSSKVDQNARNCPAFLASMRMAIVLSISALVMLPLSPYFRSPRDSMAIAASMMPIEGTATIAVLPLNSGFKSSLQCSIGRLMRSGRMPSVSALYTVGMALSSSVGPLANVFESLDSRYCTLYGKVPWAETLRPSGYSPLVKIGTVLSHHLYFFAGIGCKMLRPTM